ncbi:hypothetical protein ERO13_A10G089000v2 [Gossypium hirsutum]|uniref:Uncharacterized protein n=2 Tax=Gossypium TaxID=3633 RepID=A0A5J5U0G5_GOSBA|nr:hypothetical protein ES319_A10G095400v1 [Gossypium barbadense]KAG4179157.1 hypothetical protein ERO13_A10G089000v2 [Gossypium hirsutum]TYG98277.1 hypothetical protein ES288_A10G104600v1 [Gossypium darwinii]
MEGHRHPHAVASGAYPRRTQEHVSNVEVEWHTTRRKCVTCGRGTASIC